MKIQLLDQITILFLLNQICFISMSSLNQRESAELHKKPTTENFSKVLHEVTKTNPLPFIKKGIDNYINQRKIKKKKKFLHIYQTQSLPNNSDYDIKRYEDIYQSIAELTKKPDIKKRILISPNKVVSHEKIMEVFEPYKKQIDKLRMKKNISNQETQDTPFGHAIKQLGIFSQFDSQNKNKMIPSKPTNNVYRSLPKKQFKQKLKPISDSNIKIGADHENNRFLSVEKINLIDSDFKMRPNPAFASVNQSKGIEVFLSDQRKEIQINFKKIQQIKKEKQYRMNPQIYIKKWYQSKNIEMEQQIHEVLTSKKTEKSVNSIIKFYPSLNNHLKNKIINTNGNLAIFSYINQPQSYEQSRNAASQSQSFRLMNVLESIGNQTIQQNDDTSEGFYKSESTPINQRLEKIGQDHIQLMAKESTTAANSSIKLYRRKKFFHSLPFQTYYYRDLIWKVNYTNDMFVETPVEYQHRLKAFIGKGNNSSMLFGLIKRRIWFAITEKVQEANFVWTQLKILPYFKKQQSGKLISVCLTTQQSPKKAQYSKSGGIMNSKDQAQFKQYFETYINFEQRSDQRLLNRQKCFKYQKTIKTSEIKEQKLQNHLINNYVIGNKKALFNTMSNYYASIGQDVFNYLPLTFHIKNGVEDDSWYKFLKYYYKRCKDIKKTNQQRTDKNAKDYNSWIVKPGQNSNRGNGIQVCLTLQEIKNIVKKQEKYSDGSPKTYIVQSYIQKPLLYQKRKFDIRHYMMLTCINSKVKGYFYKDGYVRTTSSEYNLKTNCGKIHLTNDAVQKNLPDYGKYQKGNKISYQELSNYMSKQPKHKGFDFYGKIYPRMKKIATDVMKACSGGIDPEKLVNNFEVYGMDFMIDSNYDVWLIEVNSNPCLQLSCPLLGSIIPKMVQNALQLTMDCIFPPPVRYNPKGVHYYKNLEQQNRFELVYDERIDGLCTASMDVLDGKMLYEEDDTFEDDGEQWTED